MDSFTFQTHLEQLLEEMKHDTVTVESANRHFRRLGRYLLIGQEFLSPEEYQTVLQHCDLSHGDAAIAIERCNLQAKLHQHKENIHAHAGDSSWIGAELERIREDLLLSYLKQRELEEEKGS